MIQQAYKYVFREFVALYNVGVFPVELLACQVSMIYAANWPR